jgi:hypothetical protein
VLLVPLLYLTVSIIAIVFAKNFVNFFVGAAECHAMRGFGPIGVVFFAEEGRRIMASIEYKERLSAWVAAERRRLGAKDKPLSFSGLETAIVRSTGEVIDRQTLINWEGRNYTRDISSEQLAKLAKYRGETADQCRWWLEGKSEKPGKDTISDTDVIWWISNSDDPGKLLQIVQLASRRSAELISGKKNP